MSRQSKSVPRAQLSPAIIDLREVPREGSQYSYSQESGELTSAFADIIGSNPYTVDLRINPVGNAYEVSGQVKTSLNLLCSRCGIDFKYPVSESFREILLVTEKMPRQGKEARVNHSSELDPAGPNVTLLEDETFKVGDFVREIIGLAEPVQPLGKPDCDVDCENLQEAYAKGWLTRPGQEVEGAEDEVGPGRNSPFKVLKGVKLDS